MRAGDGRGANGNKDALFLFFVIRTLQSVSISLRSPRQCPRHPTLHTVATGTLHPVPKLPCPVGTFRRGNLQLKVGRISPIRHRLVWTCLHEIINSPLVDCACHARTRRETCCWCWSHLLEHPVPSEAAPVPAPARPELTTLPSLSSPAAAE